MPKTAYARMQDDNRKREYRKKHPLQESRCGATTGNGRPCQNPAGMGTEHAGIGACRVHGGRLPSHNKHAVGVDAQRQAQLMGAPLELNPLDALLWCLRITAGEIQWLTDQMGQINKDDWTELDNIGQRQLNIWARERRDRVEMLAKFSAQAVQLGLTERSIKLAETYGVMIATLLSSILKDLDPYMLQKGKEEAPKIIRRHLVKIEKEQSELRELPVVSG